MESFPLEYFHYAKELAVYSNKVYERGYVHANGGNLSVKIEDNLIMTTPTMMSKGDIRTDDMVICNFSGDILYGHRSPSSELFSHLAVYKANEHAGAIVHTHPPYTCSYACSDESLPNPLSPETIFWLGDVCIVPFLMPGSKDLSKEVERLSRNKYVLLLKNHGLITWGSTIRDAMWRTEVMESHCRISHIITERGAGCSVFSPKERVMLDKLKDIYTR